MANTPALCRRSGRPRLVFVSREASCTEADRHEQGRWHASSDHGSQLRVQKRPQMRQAERLQGLVILGDLLRRTLSCFESICEALCVLREAVPDLRGGRIGLRSMRRQTLFTKSARYLEKEKRKGVVPRGNAGISAMSQFHEHAACTAL
jgi:hypothetical protein